MLLIGSLRTVVAHAQARPAVLCVALEDPFVAGVTDRALVEAIRARVAHEQLAVVSCRQPAAARAIWRLEVVREARGVVGVRARGEGMARDESLDVDESDPAEVVRQTAIASAELMRPTLIAWFDATQFPLPVEPAPVTPEPVVASPPVVEREHPVRFGIGAHVGARLGGEVAMHAAVVGEARYRGWRLQVDVDGDRWASTTVDSVTSRFTSLELGGNLGRELVANRLWLDLGAQTRFTRATLEGPPDVVPRVSGSDWGARAAVTLTLWRTQRVQVGLTSRVSWWYRPESLVYEARPLQHQTHIDVVVAPYLQFDF